VLEEVLEKVLEKVLVQVKGKCWRSVGDGRGKVLEAVEKVLEVIGESVGDCSNTRMRGGVSWRNVTR